MTFRAWRTVLGAGKLIVAAPRGIIGATRASPQGKKTKSEGRIVKIGAGCYTPLSAYPPPLLYNSEAEEAATKWLWLLQYIESLRGLCVSQKKRKPSGFAN